MNDYYIALFVTLNASSKFIVPSIDKNPSWRGLKRALKTLRYSRVLVYKIQIDPLRVNYRKGDHFLNGMYDDTILGQCTTSNLVTHYTINANQDGYDEINISTVPALAPPPVLPAPVPPPPPAVTSAPPSLTGLLAGIKNPVLKPVNPATIPPKEVLLLEQIRQKPILRKIPILTEAEKQMCELAKVEKSTNPVASALYKALSDIKRYQGEVVYSKNSTAGEYADEDWD